LKRTADILREELGTSAMGLDKWDSVL